MADTLNVPGKLLSEFKPSTETSKQAELKMLAGMQKITEQYPHSFLVGQDQEGFPFIVSRGDENGLSTNHILIDRTGIYHVVAHALSESLHQNIGQPGAIEKFRSNVETVGSRVGSIDKLTGQVCNVPDGKTTGIDSFIYIGVSADPLAKDEDMQYTLRAHDHVMLADLQYENMVNTQKKLDSLSVKFEHPLYKARHKLIFGDHSDESKRTVLESQDGMFSEEVTLQDGSTFQRDVVPTENGYLVIMNYLPNTGEPSQSFSITAEIDNDSLTIRTVMPGDICEHIYEPRMSKIPFAALGTKFIDAVNEHGPYTTTVDIVSAEVITPDDVKWGTAPARSTEFVGIVGGVDKKVTVTESEGKINVAESFF